MGLLNNPTTRRKLVTAISKYNNKLCVLCYIVGLLWFLALAHRPFNAGTYFSENALLPGLVDSSFYSDYGSGDALKELREELKDRKAKDEQLGKRIPAGWLESKFRSIGLDTYVQNFTFQYPEAILGKQTFTGQNVYGILRAPRAASTEALVLTAPYRSPDNVQDKTAGGIALMIGIAKAFRKHTYWAKDIIFLVTELEQVGMQAWLSAYHHAPTPYIEAGELAGRSGSIQAAVNLEIPGDSVSKFNIKLEGLNGQLPNLDLVNTVVRLCKRERITPTLHKRNDYWHPDSREGFTHALQTMLLMMWHQAPGTPTGNHGLFLRYHIEAVTLQGVKIKNAKSYGFQDMGRIVEGIFRSLNNLLERFHQSFFFYLLPATERYVSIGLYMPPFGVLALPIIIKALALWISYQAKTTEEEEKEDEVQKCDKQTEGAGDAQAQPSSNNGGFLNLVPVFILAAFFGMLAHSTTRFFIESAAVVKMPAHEGLGVGSLAVFMAAVAFPYLLRRKSRQKNQPTGPDWQLLKCLSLLATGIVLGGAALMNISLAYFIAAVWVPILLLVKPRTNRLAKLLQYILLLLISPLSLLYGASVAQNIITRKTALHPATLLYESLDTFNRGLLLSVVDMHMFGNWIFTLASVAMFPIWLLFWALLWTEPY